MREYRFDFGRPAACDGYIKVGPEDTYTVERGFGFVNSTADGPFFFKVDLPEGNYTLRFLLGDRNGTSDTTIKAESRRLLAERIPTSAGEIARFECAVNVRRPLLATGERLILNERELPFKNWNDSLTIELNGPRPRLRALEILPAPDAVTVFLAGDSTVTDQEYEPWAAWGQMLPAFFNEHVSIANYAESGESLKSFVAEHRFTKIMETIRAGDFLFIQFGHNDQKEGPYHAEASGAYTEYLERFVVSTREKGATAVLITPMHRRRFDEHGKIVNTLSEYPDTVRKSARELETPLIDLNEMSRTLYETLGPEESKKLFVHFPAGSYPGMDEEVRDDTHFRAYGAFQLAKCIVKGITDNGLSLVRFLRSPAS